MKIHPIIVEKTGSVLIKQRFNTSEIETSLKLINQKVFAISQIREHILSIFECPRICKRGEDCIIQIQFNAFSTIVDSILLMQVSN